MRRLFTFHYIGERKGRQRIIAPNGNKQRWGGKWLYIQLGG
ncbi:hypothetical protein TGS27_1958 [Geobacillus stearothermophilus]|uniref:Uncharacterized protein n=1 Tax=Geobacillus stearothermophilus TaxID=1422 RepID=A0A150MBA4_GEOSE|nr:hypothetical protein GS8_2191 [Geobacillus stearothermophilus]KYD21736.1 hypothetical protein B4109_2061 [Geobacillus stearothermophilus]KYD33719.1 hypothetical protein B4114_2265 [Geobacillus stearothermophilus]OAO80129.1 hypothetical protein TGS27_1958 [Geobacillus stearothermophilus]